MASINVLMNRFEGLCAYCKRRCVFASPLTNPLCATADHWLPRARGGEGNTNKVLACYRCNNAKDDMTGEEFKHFLDTGKLAPSFLDYLHEKYRRRLTTGKPAAYA